MAIILPYKDKYPKIAPNAFIAENAVIIGDVEIGAEASIWFNCVLRGDVNYIRVGEGSNIQDGTIVHVNRREGPAIIGKGVTVGHSALLHACRLEDYSFIGMGAKVIDYVTVKTNAMVGAGSLVPPKKVVNTGELWTGVPAKLHRLLTQDEINFIKTSEQNYKNLAFEYLNA
ncbi:gamma carbonic anhydrase family protein [Holosporaceae bacterium 'Namur']|nr:gamma carbonic anhydrase family protein [Holosporaceae bacterium 'Namur']